MTTAGQIQDQLISLISTNLSAYAELEDVIDPSDSASVNLEKGYAVSFGSATNTERFLGCNKKTIERNFLVSLTNGYTAQTIDPSLRRDSEQGLMADLFTVISAIENDPTIGGLAYRGRYTDDSGIAYLEDQEKQYISVVATIAVEYAEV